MYSGESMSTIDCVANRIMELCREKNLSLNGLARSAGLPSTTLKNILNGASQNPGIVTIKMLCDGFSITLVEFFDTKEFQELEQKMK